MNAACLDLNIQFEEDAKTVARNMAKLWLIRVAACGLLERQRIYRT
jgi:hypothetical protein